MIEIDLGNLSVPELQELAKTVENEIEKRQSESKKVVLDQIKELAQSIGMTIEDVIGRGKKSQKRSALPPSTMYVNPENPQQTWSGRGRRPNWAREMLGRGIPLTTLETR